MRSRWRRCGWAAAYSTQFLLDENRTRVARLTNDTNQLGTLWLQDPQPYASGFTALFSFRVSEPSECTLPLEVYGTKIVASAAESGESFTPFPELAQDGETMTHYLIDDPLLPFDPVPPPQGVPLELAETIGSCAVDGRALPPDSSGTVRRGAGALLERAPGGSASGTWRRARGGGAAEGEAGRMACKCSLS